MGGGGLAPQAPDTRRLWITKYLQLLFDFDSAMIRLPFDRRSTAIGLMNVSVFLLGRRLDRMVVARSKFSRIQVDS